MRRLDVERLFRCNVDPLGAGFSAWKSKWINSTLVDYADFEIGIGEWDFYELPSSR
jgi:hypothetical protein